MANRYEITDLLAPLYFDHNGRLSDRPPTVLTTTYKYPDPAEAIVVGWEGNAEEPVAWLVYSNAQVEKALRDLDQDDLERLPLLISGRPRYHLDGEKEPVKLEGLLARQIRLFAPMYKRMYPNDHIVRLDPPPLTSAMFVMDMGDQRSPSVFGHFSEPTGLPAVTLFDSKDVGLDLLNDVPNLPPTVRNGIIDRLVSGTLPDTSDRPCIQIENHWLRGWFMVLYQESKNAKKQSRPETVTP